MQYKKNKKFYTILYRDNISYIIFDTINKSLEPLSQNSGMDSYVKSLLSYGVYGIINEWIGRGMQESAEELTSLLQQLKTC